MTGKTENNFEAVSSAWASATAGASERPDNRESLRAKAAPLMLPQGVINAMKMEAAQAAESERLKKITIQELQDLAARKVAELVSDFDHGFRFSAMAYLEGAKVLEPSGFVPVAELISGVLIHVEVHRTDSMPFRTVMPLICYLDRGFCFMGGEFVDIDTPLSPELFWFVMFSCALMYCEASNA